MRFSRLLTVIVCVAAWWGTAGATDAGFWHQANPKPFFNYINRCLGIGWSDGYHAYGSSTSWVRPERHTHQRYQPYGVMTSPRYSTTPNTGYGTWPANREVIMTPATGPTPRIGK